MSSVLPDSSPATTGLPRHVAIVMDGNGRWAKKRHLPRVAGHKQGVDALRRTVRSCLEKGISVLTVFREVPKLHKNGVRLHFPGDRTGLSSRVVQGLQKAQETTAGNDRLVLNVCFNYGGRWDIAQAARRLVAEGREITEAALNETTALAHVGDPDLLIRTGGEMRISNFLLWQVAYAELYFSSCLWPDFDGEELDRAVADFASRERRFGQTSEQVMAVGPSGTSSAGGAHHA